MEEKILEVLENIKPYLENDGGGLEFIKYEDNTVYIKLTGACHGCPHRSQTLEYSIKEMLKDAIPEIEEVINVDL